MFEVEITTSNLKKFCPCRLTKAQKVSRLNIASHLSFHSQVEATNVLTHCHLALPPLWFKGIWREEFLLSAIHSHPSTLLPAGSRSVGRSYIRVKNAGRTRSFGVNVANVVYTIYIFEFEHIYIIYIVQYRPVMCIRDPAKKKWVAHLFHPFLVWSGWSKPTLLGCYAESFNNR